MKSVNIFEAMLSELAKFIPRSIALGILKSALKKIGSSEDALKKQRRISEPLLQEIKGGLRLFVSDEKKQRDCITFLQNLGAPSSSEAGRLGGKEFTQADVIKISEENDIVVARNQARQKADTIGFSNMEQIKIATAVSELARNIIRYAGHGNIEIVALDGPKKGLRIVATDKGPGINNLEEIMSGQYKSKTGMGLGLQGCKKLMDDFTVSTRPQTGTTVTLQKFVG